MMIFFERFFTQNTRYPETLVMELAQRFSLSFCRPYMNPQKTRILARNLPTLRLL